MKSINDFYVSKSKKNGYEKQCKVCRKENVNLERRHLTQWRFDHKHMIFKDISINLEIYNEMFNNQNGCCAICKTHQSKLTQKLCIDHNHKTGKVRGLLCHFCNSVLGFSKDDSIILTDAIVYLKKHIPDQFGY